MRFTAASLLLPVVALVSLTANAALTVNGYDPNRHERFANDPAFIGTGFDWSGIGKSNQATSRWGTLVTPSFMISATHFVPSGSVRFFQSNDPAGPFVDRNIVQSIVLTQDGSAKTSDLVLLRLDSPVTGVNPFPVLDLGLHSAYTGLPITVVGQSTATTQTGGMRFGTNTIGEVVPLFSDPGLNSGNTENDVFVFDLDPGVADQAQLEAFDSGAPSFVITDSGPAIVGVHWFNGTDGVTGNRLSGDTLVSSFVDELNTAIGLTGSSELISVVTAVPEPSFGGLLVALLLVRRRSQIQGRR